MPVDPDKRELRKHKRVLKRAGSKHRRRALKDSLRDNPEEAAHVEEDLGGNRSDDLNGIDRDSTRRRNEAGEDGKFTESSE